LLDNSGRNHFRGQAAHLCLAASAVFPFSSDAALGYACLGFREIGTVVIVKSPYIWYVTNRMQIAQPITRFARPM